MKISLPFLLTMFITRADSISTCNRVSVGGSGTIDGVYISIIEYRGRPDFYREDGKYNLFGEDVGTNKCQWRIDNTDFEYPYYLVDDCSYHPVDIAGDWYIIGDEVDSVKSEISIICIEEESSKKGLIVNIVIVSISIVAIILLIAMHVIIRKRRLSKATNECIVCNKIANDAASVVRKSFSA